MRTPWIVIPLIAVALTGCSANSNKSASDSSRQNGVAAPEAAKPAPGLADKPGQPPAKVNDSEVTRSIIYTGNLVLVVKSVDLAAADAAAAATRARGFVGGDQRSIGKSQATANLTLRVPSAAFYATVTEVAKLGTEQSREIKTEDVSTAVVDVEARIAAQRASVLRIRTLLDKANGLAEISTIEAELAKREAELNSLEARKRTLDDQTALSTITVKLMLAEPEAKPVVAKKKETGFVAGLASGWKGFTGLVDGLLTVFGALLPFLVAVLIPTGAVVWWFRRASPRRSARSRPSGG